MTLIANRQVDLGIAMETEEGLFVPVIRDVNARSTDDLQGALDRLKTAIAERSIAADEIRGQTITLSNFGSVGGLYAQMVGVPPQGAIVGAGRTFPRVAPGPDRAGVDAMLPISITFDHRAVTGVEACRFLNALVSDLERPLQ